MTTTTCWICSVCSARGWMERQCTLGALEGWTAMDPQCPRVDIQEWQESYWDRSLSRDEIMIPSMRCFLRHGVLSA